MFCWTDTERHTPIAIPATTVKRISPPPNPSPPPSYCSSPLPGSPSRTIRDQESVHGDETALVSFVLDSQLEAHSLYSLDWCDFAHLSLQMAPIHIDDPQRDMGRPRTEILGRSSRDQALQAPGLLNSNSETVFCSDWAQRANSSYAEWWLCVSWDELPNTIEESAELALGKVLAEHLLWSEAYLRSKHDHSSTASMIPHLLWQLTTCSCCAKNGTNEFWEPRCPPWTDGHMQYNLRIQRTNFRAPTKRLKSSVCLWAQSIAGTSSYCAAIRLMYVPVTSHICRQCSAVVVTANPFRISPIFRAIRNRDFSAVRRLLSEGQATILDRDNEGNLPLAVRRFCNNSLRL